MLRFYVEPLNKSKDGSPVWCAHNWVTVSSLTNLCRWNGGRPLDSRRVHESTVYYANMKREEYA